MTCGDAGVVQNRGFRRAIIAAGADGIIGDDDILEHDLHEDVLGAAGRVFLHLVGEAFGEYHVDPGENMAFGGWLDSPTQEGSPLSTLLLPSPSLRLCAGVFSQV